MRDERVQGSLNRGLRGVEGHLGSREAVEAHLGMGGKIKFP